MGQYSRGCVPKILLICSHVCIMPRLLDSNTRGSQTTSRRVVWLKAGGLAYLCGCCLRVKRRRGRGERRLLQASVRLGSVCCKPCSEWCFILVWL